MLKTNIENKCQSAMPLANDYDSSADDTSLAAGIDGIIVSDTSLAAGIDGMIVGDTPFTLAFTQEFIGAHPTWKWPQSSALGPERLKGLMTFAQLLLSGAQTGTVDSGAHPGDLDSTLLANVKKFLAEYEFEGVVGWPDTAEEQALVAQEKDGPEVRMAEAALLLMRVIRASGSNLDGGGNGPVKYPIKPA